MLKFQTQFHVRYAIDSDAFELYVMQEDMDDRDSRAIGTSITFVPMVRGCRSDPLMYLTKDEAQQLANRLWDAGIRPVGAAGSAGQLTAVSYHLEDLRRLVPGLVKESQR